MMRSLPTVVLAAGLILTGCSENPSGGESRSAPPPRPASMDRSPKTGKQLYAMHCQACHGEDGQGVPQVFPPITASQQLQVPATFVHALIHGYPPPEPGEQNWMGEMPKFGHLSDEQLARLANYVRKRWGGFDEEVTAALVAEQRANR